MRRRRRELREAGRRGRRLRATCASTPGSLAHMHLSWLDPHKERRFTVVGSKRMATFDDMELERKLTVYDKGFDEDYSSYGEYIARSGDIYSPRISNEEPLRIECSALRRVHPGRQPSRASGAESALRVVRVLERLQRSLAESSMSPGAELLASDRAPGPPARRGRRAAGRRGARRARGGARRDAGSARARGCRTAAWSASRWRWAPLERGRRRGAAAAPSSARGRRSGAGAVVLAGAAIGERCVVADQAHVRERTSIGDECVVGRGASVENDVRIGARVRMQTGAYVTAWSVVEDDVFIAPGVMFTNDPTAGRRAGRRGAARADAAARVPDRRRRGAAAGRRDRRGRVRRGGRGGHARRAARARS